MPMGALMSYSWPTIARPTARGACAALIAALALLANPVAARAQPATTIDDLAAAVVRIKAFINPDGRTVQNLGTEREGSGIVIGSDGLVLTIGYLMVEAHAAEVATNGGQTVPANVVGYDHETGFGLLRAAQSPQGAAHGPRQVGRLKEKDPVLVASFGGTDMVAPVHVAAPPRVRGQLGVPARGGDLHLAPASRLERGGADQPRGQARRRRLADRRRRRRQGRRRARQHVRADRPAAADPGRPDRRRARVGRRRGRGSA